MLLFQSLEPIRLQHVRNVHYAHLCIIAGASQDVIPMKLHGFAQGFDEMGRAAISMDPFEASSPCIVLLLKIH